MEKKISLEYYKDILILSVYSSLCIHLDIMGYNFLRVKFTFIKGNFGLHTRGNFPENICLNTEYNHSITCFCCGKDIELKNLL